MSQLNGKYAIITGGANGIGAAIAANYIGHGIGGVALLDINADSALQTANRLASENVQMLAIGCDVSKEAQVQAAADQVFAAFGQVDILVNNAGIIRDSMVHKMSTAQWSSVIDVCLNGTYYMSRAIIGQMRQAEKGNIINISSIASEGSFGQCNYAAAKAGIIAFTKTLALESAKKGIRVNAIAPGYVDTEILRAIPEQAYQAIVGKIPMGRMCSVEEIAEVAYFLASDQSNFITGECLKVSGGETHL